MIFRDIARQIHPQRVINKVVFDLDQLLRQPGDPGGAHDNGLLAVAKEQLKLGHARKHSNSRFIHRINACLICQFNLSMCESIFFKLKLSRYTL